MQRLYVYLMFARYLAILNRIANAQSPSYGTITYQYNQIGNITYNSQLGSYTYGTKPHAVIQAGTNSYQYDANGNMTNRPNQTITYDYDNRPIAINGTTFIYDYAGQRIKKNNTIYIGKLYECTNGTCTKYIFAGSSRIASKTAAATYYFHTDNLGSSSIITDNSGNKVQETYYYPFGGTRLNTGNVVKHKYTGQEEDTETGLYYYNARYYDPMLGRFISADSIVGNPRDPQDLNRYTYAGNNPLIYTDPSGHLKFKSIFKGISRILNEAVKYIRKHDEAFAIGGIIAAPFTGGWSMLPYAYGQSPKTTTSILVATGTAYGAYVLGMPAILGNAISGAASSAVTGGDVKAGFITGAITGSIPQLKIFDNAQALGFIANDVITSFVRGTAAGAINIGLHGGNIGDVLKYAGTYTAFAQGTNAIGHTVGFIGSGFSKPEFDAENGVFRYYSKNISGAITLGNVMFAEGNGFNDFLGQEYKTGGKSYTYYQHELSHVEQYKYLGPAYIPAHVLSLSIGTLLGGHHEYGLLERGLIRVPSP